LSRTTHLLAALIFASPAVAAEPELLPAPRPVERQVWVEPTPGGYQVTLSRKATDRLVGTLAVVGDGQAVADIAKSVTKDLNDPEAAAKIDMIAWVVKTQAPALRKSLEEKAGPGGAVIRVFGLEKKRIDLKDRPLLKAVGETFLPDDLKDRVKTAMAVANTTPLYWKVEGRK
jgi:hypothetical protein